MPDVKEQAAQLEEGSTPGDTPAKERDLLQMQQPEEVLGKERDLHMQQTESATETHVEHRGRDCVRFDPFSRWLPPVLLPSKIVDPLDSDAKAEWLPRTALANPTLALLYDLVFVAVFTAASSANIPLSDGGNIGRFASFWVLVWWTWFSQALYDTRFQANDRLHRIFKMFQLSTFLILGSSGKWAPTKIIFIPLDYSDRAVEHFEAQASFQTVATAYAVSRGVLFLQYAYLGFVAHDARRPRGPFVIPAASAFASFVLTLLSGVIRASNRGSMIAKITLLYSALGTEVCGELISCIWRDHLRPPFSLMAERLGCLTLIIFGEGLIQILLATNTAISGFGGSSAVIYGQVICSIFIIFFAWALLFDGFVNAHHWVGRRRSMIYYLGFWPLQFVIVLFIMSIVNNIRFQAIQSSAIHLSINLSGVLRTITGDSMSMSITDLNRFGLEITKLKTLEPSWSEEVLIINSAVNDPANPNDPSILFNKYFANAALALFELYDVEASDHVKSLNSALQATNDTRIADQAARLAVQVDMANQLLNLLDTVQSQLLPGTFWLYPAAGLVMTISALLNITRAEYRGRRLRVIEYLQVGVGSALALLGLLNLGSQEYNDSYDARGNLIIGPMSPYLGLLIQRAALPIVTAVYGALWIAQLAILDVARHRQHVGGRAPWVVHRVQADIEPSDGFKEAKAKAR